MPVRAIVVALLVLIFPGAGAADDGSGHDGAHPHDGGPAALGDAAVRDVRLDPDAPAPVVAIEKGAPISLRVHGAGGGALHVHGYDIAVHGRAGEPVRIDLDPQYSGRFPVVTHRHDALLGDRETALFYIEVRDR